VNKRMVAIIKMLSSTSDGEVVNAARLLGAELKRQGKDWHDLGEYLSRWDGGAGPIPAKPEPRTTRGQAPEAPRPYPGWQRRAAETAVDLTKAKEMVEELLTNHLTRLSRKDANFIEAMSDAFDIYGERTKVSEGQYNWIQNLHTNFCENKGRRR
jgi:hypothetical protein